MFINTANCIVASLIIWLTIQVGVPDASVAWSLTLEEPDQENPKSFEVMVPEKGLTEKERHFFECVKEIDSIDFENASIKDITPSLRRFFIRLHNLDPADPNVSKASVTIEYDIHAEMPVTLNGVRLTQVIVLYNRGVGARLDLRMGSAFHPHCWSSIEYTSPIDEAGRFLPPIPLLEKPKERKSKAIHVELHSNGHPSQLVYYGLENGTPCILDRETHWGEDGMVTKSQKYESPQPLNFKWR